MRVPLSLVDDRGGLRLSESSHQDLGIATDQMMNSLFNNYVLLAVPMFILAANVMNAGTISERLWQRRRRCRRPSARRARSCHRAGIGRIFFA